MKMRTATRGASVATASRPRRILGLRLIVTVAAALLTAAGVLGVGAVAERESRENLDAELRSRLLLTARHLAIVGSGALLSEYPELTLHPLIRELKQDEPALTLAVVVDHQGIIQGHSDARQLGGAYTAPEALAPLAGVRALHPGESLSQGETLLLAESPVLHPGGEPIGKAVVGVRRSYIAERLREARQQLLIVLGGILVLTLALILVLMSRLLRPVGVLRGGLERIGRGELDTVLPVTGRTEFSLLASAVNEMAGRLRGAQAELVEKERLAHELDLAREIQSGLLPEKELQAGPFLIAGAHRAALVVGGDYYDYLRLPDGRIALAIADVSGKGLAGCMIMSMLSALWRSHAPRYDSPRELLLALDAQLAQTLKSGQFVTMFYGLLDVRASRLRFASAAHSPLMHRKADGDIEWRKSTGIPLGAVSTAMLARSLVDEELELAPGDLLLQYTDGINEAFDPAGNQFGLTGIESCARTAGRQGPRALLEGLRRSVSTWSAGGLPSDDETLLVLAHQGVATPASPPAEPAVVAAELLALLARAEQEGRHLELPADLPRLAALHDWLAECRALRLLNPEASHLVRTAVYEAAANVAEHACGLDATRHFDLWSIVMQTPGATTGHFLLRDRGHSFRPEEQAASDLSDPSVRRRGRGLGLDLIRGISSRFAYAPGTPAGNLTLLTFSFDPEPADKEPVHAG